MLWARVRCSVAFVRGVWLEADAKEEEEEEEEEVLRDEGIRCLYALLFCCA